MLDRTDLSIEYSHEILDSRGWPNWLDGAACVVPRKHFSARQKLGSPLLYRKRKYTKINQLKRLSAAIWDEDNFIISLDHEHYTDYIKDHKADDEYLNKPLEHYGLMATIFGNSVATGQCAKGSNEPLVVDVDSTDGVQGDGNNGTTIADENRASASATRPSKRAKLAENEDEGLTGAFKSASDTVAKAIVKAATAAYELPPDLFQNVTSLAGFDDTHKAYYYSYLVVNPREALAFNNLPFDYKLIFMAKYVSDHFSPC